MRVVVPVTVLVGVLVEECAIGGSEVVSVSMSVRVRR